MSERERKLTLEKENLLGWPKPTVGTQVIVSMHCPEELLYSVFCLFVCLFFNFLFIYFLKIFILFLNYIIVLVLPNIIMNPPQVYICCTVLCSGREQLFTSVWSMMDSDPISVPAYHHAELTHWKIRWIALHISRVTFNWRVPSTR